MMPPAEGGGTRYVLLMSPDGRYLGSHVDGLALAARAADSTMWLIGSGRADGHAGPAVFFHPTTRVSMQASPVPLPTGTPAAEGVVQAAGPA